MTYPRGWSDAERIAFLADLQNTSLHGIDVTALSQGEASAYLCRRDQPGRALVNSSVVVKFFDSVMTPGDNLDPHVVRPNRMYWAACEDELARQDALSEAEQNDVLRDSLMMGRNLRVNAPYDFDMDSPVMISSLAAQWSAGLISAEDVDLAQSLGDTLICLAERPRSETGDPPELKSGELLTGYPPPSKYDVFEARVELGMPRPEPRPPSGAARVSFEKDDNGAFVEVPLDAEGNRLDGKAERRA